MYLATYHFNGPFLDNSSKKLLIIILYKLYSAAILLERKIATNNIRKPRLFSKNNFGLLSGYSKQGITFLFGN